MGKKARVIDNISSMFWESSSLNKDNVKINFSEEILKELKDK